MPTKITYSGGPEMVPFLVELSSRELTAPSGTVEHIILDGDPVYTLRRGQPVTGALSLAFASAISASDCLRAHSLPTTFRVSDADRPELNFTYVVPQGDSAKSAPDADVGVALWRVVVPFREVS